MTKTETTKKVKTQRIKAGTVIVMKYQGENKPCDKSMAILMTPVTLRDGETLKEGFRTMYAIDTDADRFLPAGPINNVTCSVSVATPRLKAWYFEQLVRLCYGDPCKKPKVWVVTFINNPEMEIPSVSAQVFGSYDDARKSLDEEWQTLTTQAEYNEDVSRKSDDDFLFVDNRENRVIGEIKERILK